MYIDLLHAAVIAVLSATACRLRLQHCALLWSTRFTNAFSRHDTMPYDTRRQKMFNICSKDWV